MSLNFDVIETLSAFVVLFAIIDILGSIPIIVGLKKKGEVIKASVVSLVAFVILLVFLFCGNWILKFFNVDIQSFAVAGALVLFMFAIEMLCDIEIFQNKGPKGSASIVPLAFPLVAGPGTFTALLSIGAEYHEVNIVVALALNMVFVYIVLKSTDKIVKWMGEGGIYVLRKFFGIILLAIAVKLFATNIGYMMQHFKTEEVAAMEQVVEETENATDTLTMENVQE